MSPIADEKDYVYSTHPGTGLYKLETGWHTPTSMDGSMSRNHSISSGLAMLGVDERGSRGSGQGHDIYGNGMPWTPPTDMSSAPYNEMPMSMSGHHSRSASMDVAMSHMTPTWGVDLGADMIYGSPSQMPTPASTGSNYFPSPSATPNLRPVFRHKSGSAATSGGSSSCTCFTVCLQSLQALHNASSPASPPFDLVLSLNRKAVEGCAAMLACPRCMSRSGTHTAAMLLATVIGKITSFYKNASQAYFEAGGAAPAAIPSHHGSPGTGLGVCWGTYMLGGEDGRWLELEILARELRKLEEVYAQFRDVCAELSDDAEVSRAMIGYLNHNLGTTLEVVSHRKGDMGYA
jgi:hypothetical protein